MQIETIVLSAKNNIHNSFDDCRDIQRCVLFILFSYVVLFAESGKKTW